MTMGHLLGVGHTVPQKPQGNNCPPHFLEEELETGEVGPPAQDHTAVAYYSASPSVSGPEAYAVL